jgi:AcrR family transcriptional regulator
MDSMTTRDEQREAILGSAHAQFARFGFQKATVEDIARGAGLKKSSLYYYFESKSEIINIVLRREGEALLSRMVGAAAREGSTEERLRAFFHERYAYFKEKKRLGVVSRDEMDEMRPVFLAARDAFFQAELEALSNLLEQGIAAGDIAIGDPGLCALVAIASLRGIDDIFWRQGLEDQLEAGLDLVMTIFFDGLRKEPVK